MNKLKSLLLIVAVCSWSNANELDSLPSFGISTYIGDVQAYSQYYSDDWLPSIEIPINLGTNVIIQPGISYQFNNFIYNDTLGNKTGNHYFKLQPSIAAYLRLNKNTNPNIFSGVKLKYIYISTASDESYSQWGQICILLG
jgi:hypothetical protein